MTRWPRSRRQRHRVRRIALVVGEHRAVRCVDGGRDDFVLRLERGQNLARRLLVLEGEGRHAVGADDLRLGHEVVTHAGAERRQVIGEEPDRGQSSASELVTIAISINLRLIERFLKKRMFLHSPPPDGSVDSDGSHRRPWMTPKGTFMTVAPRGQG